MTELSNQKADERKRIIIHKRQNKNIKVCRRSRVDLNNNEEGTAESVKGQRAVAPADLNNEEGTAESVKGQRAVAPLTLIIIMRKEQQNQ